jgi:hypothetical protein
MNVLVRGNTIDKFESDSNRRHANTKIIDGGGRDARLIDVHWHTYSAADAMADS